MAARVGSRHTNMFNREKITATVSYYDGVDAYGQEMEDISSTKEIKGAFGLISQGLTGDYRYIDATHYFLTTDNTVTDKCILTIDGHDYKVKYVSPHRRLNEVFLS